MHTKKLLELFLAVLFVSSGILLSKNTYVREYTKKNGTYVSGHVRETKTSSTKSSYRVEYKTPSTSSRSSTSSASAASKKSISINSFVSSASSISSEKTSTKSHNKNYSTVAQRDENGKIKRSEEEKKFMKETGYLNGKPGYVCSGSYYSLEERRY